MRKTHSIIPALVRQPETKRISPVHGAGSPFTGPAGGVGSNQITTLTVDGRSLQLSARITL